MTSRNDATRARFDFAMPEPLDGDPGTRIASTVAECLDLQPLGDDAFLASRAHPSDPRGLYGGRLTAQALRAAAHTVEPDRLAHSLHSYFLVPADASKPITYEVSRERDGRQYSVRRVTAYQDGRAILNLDASFQTLAAGADFQAEDMPPTPPAESLVETPQDPRMLDLDVRIPADPDNYHRWPTRLWIRIKNDISTDANVRTCGLTFISDMCTGLSKAPMVKQVGILPSIDHSVWVHRPVDPNRWMLIDLAPESTSHGRGMYTGRIYNEDQVLLANLAQESLFRIRTASTNGSTSTNGRADTNGTGP